MADIKKFLDQAGVSTLWGRVAAEVSRVDAKVTGHETRLTAAEGKIEALEAGTYDDTEIRGLIETNATAIGSNAADIAKNTSAITLLNSGAEVAGSVANTAATAAAAKVAEVVAEADTKFDTLKEIADWILSDTTGAAGMVNDIDALQAQLVGVESTVVAKIAAEIEAALEIEGVDKYALASDLTALAGRVKALEDAGYQNAEQVGSAIDAKITALNLAESYDVKGAAAAAETNAKAHADGLNTVMDTRVKALEAIDHSKILSDANVYTDQEIAKIQALTEAEILQAIQGEVTE